MEAGVLTREASIPILKVFVRIKAGFIMIFVSIKVLSKIIFVPEPRTGPDTKMFIVLQSLYPAWEKIGFA